MIIPETPSTGEHAQPAEGAAHAAAHAVANTAAAAASTAASAVSSTASAVSSTASAVATVAAAVASGVAAVGSGAAAVASGAAAVASNAAAVASGAAGPVRRKPVPAPKGDRNENPPNIGLFDLLREDFRTHRSDPFAPGFWAVAVHRFGNWRMSVRFKPARAPLTVMYKAAHYSVTWFFGIDLPYTAKLGRRVRLGHHGCMHLGARAIGDDVYIRHAATIGLLDPKERWAKPTIGDRVEIGPGAAVLGDIVVGHDTIIGANTVLGEDVPPHSRVLGNPARHVDFAKLAEPMNNNRTR